MQIPCQKNKMCKYIGKKYSTMIHVYHLFSNTNQHLISLKEKRIPHHFLFISLSMISPIYYIYHKSLFTNLSHQTSRPFSLVKQTQNTYWKKVDSIIRVFNHVYALHSKIYLCISQHTIIIILHYIITSEQIKETCHVGINIHPETEPKLKFSTKWYITSITRKQYTLNQKQPLNFSPFYSFHMYD